MPWNEKVLAVIGKSETCGSPSVLPGFEGFCDQ
jgi:hypothetical protein